MNRILVIEDEDLLRENLKEMLELKGHQIILANNGKMGVQKAIENNPDLIICDIMMPEMDGYEVLKHLRHNIETSEIPFIFLTAKSEASDTRTGMNLGADDYITKPFLVDDLNKAIQLRLERRKKTINHIRHKVEESIVKINNISAHEYNTPLNGIIGLTDLMLDFYDDFSKADMVEMLYAIKKSGKRLQHTISNILLLAHLQKCANDKANYQQDPIVKKRSVYQEIIEKEAREKAIQYEREEDIRIAVDAFDARISDEDLKHLISEVIDNAFKFSESGTPIEINTIKNAGSVIVQVTDKGRGIKYEDINKVGTPFIQFEREKYEQQGVGLGLCLVKKLCELNNAKLLIDSDYGYFTKVSVVIPTE